MSNYMCEQMKKWVRYNDELYATNIATCVLNALFAFGTIVGNAMVILAIVRTTALHKPSYILLCTLAFSDFCVGLIVQPLFTAVRIAEMTNNSDLYCKLGMAYFSTCGVWLWLSCFTIVAVSVDRFLAVYLRMKYRVLVTVKRVMMTVGVMLLAAFLLAVAYVFKMSSYYHLINVIIPICLVFSAVCYIQISRMIAHQQQQIRSHNAQSMGGFVVARYKQSLNTVLFVYIAFLLCYLPYLGFSITISVLGRTLHTHAAYLITATLVLSNSLMNPILYYWRIPELRRAVRSISFSSIQFD